MQTTDALQRFYDHCQKKGLTSSSIRGYKAYLKHFADQYPELPTDTESIERYLIARKEGPGHRDTVYKRVQSFYSYLQSVENIPSPVPARGPMGRPKKVARGQDRGVSTHEPDNLTPFGKVVEGGGDLSRYTSISTSSACLAFLQRRQVKGCTKKTIDEYTHLLRRFAVAFNKVPLKPQELDSFLANPAWGSVTRWEYRRYLVAFYHFLEEFQYIPKGMVTVPSVKKENKLRRLLTREELSSLWSYCQDFQEKCILTALVDTKCRAGELVSMDREKIFPDHALVKGKVGERQIPLTRETYDMLCKLSSSGPLFKVLNHRMPTRYLYDVVHALMLRAGLKGEKLGPHILRHTAATEHILAGGSERVLQQELGHTTPIMTALYSHLAEGQLNSEHQRINLLHRLMPQKPSAAGALELVQTDTPLPVGGSIDLGQPSQGEEAPAEKRLAFSIRTRKI